MVNTAPPASNTVYGREKLFWFDKINISNHVCRCGAVVEELLALTGKPGSTPGCFLFLCTIFFSVWSLFFNTIFPFGLFSFFLLLTLLVMQDQYIYFKRKSGVLFWKRDFKSSAWSAYWLSLRPEKKQAVKTCPSSERAEFFSVLVNIMTNNTQYTTNCTNLHPTATSGPLAKVRLAFVHRLNHQYYYPKISTGFAPKK